MKTPFSSPVAIGALGLAPPVLAPPFLAPSGGAGTLGEAAHRAIEIHPEGPHRRTPAVTRNIYAPVRLSETDRQGSRLATTGLDNHAVTDGERRDAVSVGFYRRHAHAEQMAERLRAPGLGPERAPKPLP